MTRGTTPTHEFTLPFLTSSITILNIAYSQDDEVILEKDLDDCTLGDYTITVKLTEEETLLFSEGVCKIQLRIGEGDERLASTYMDMLVYGILKEGELS